MTHNCIKCSRQYQSADSDPYYCGSCDEQRKRVVATMERERGGVVAGPVQSNVAQYDLLPKVNGFPKASDLGWL